VLVNLSSAGEDELADDLRGALQKALAEHLEARNADGEGGHSPD
jgi:hypothetical protein